MVIEKSQVRYIIIIGIAAVFALVILIRLGAIMLTGPRSDTNPLGQPRAERGPIYDRQGRILAVQTEQPTLSAWTPSVRNPESIAALLENILGMDAEDLLQRLTESTGYLILKRNLNPSETEAVTLLLQQGELPGLSLEEGKRRLYPEGSLAAHVVGFSGLDNQGLEGIELTQNEVLAPEGQKQGNQIYLTIDAEIQYTMDRLGQEALDAHNADAVMILVTSAKTGEVLGWTSVPSFDPNNLRASTPEQRKNRPIQSMYEPGSVFKIFSVAAILNTGAIDENTLFRTAGGYVRDDIGPPITDLNNYGTITAEGIIQFSSNVGAALASDLVNAQDFFYLLRQYGFGDRTGIPLNGEQIGILRDPRSWSPRSKPTIAIGQEIAVTALQMVSAATVFGNNGVLLQPHIIKSISTPGGEPIYTASRTPVRQVLSQQTVAKMLAFMNTAADFGTGQRARIEGIDISIKTGTAETIDPETGQYSNERFLASSLALFPTENPELIVYVVIDHPRGEIFGGRIAAPIIRQAAEFLIPYYGIRLSQDTRFVQDQQIRVVEPTLPEIGPEMPDFRGLSLRTILPLLDSEVLDVRLEGDAGWVLEQDPSPGTPVQPGTVLVLELSSDPRDFGSPALESDSR